MQNMSEPSQNALVKIIEEPPKHLHFIFTATSRGALLGTILSRAMLNT
jgi:DNA polymerase-3 subunit delta'